MAGHPAIERRDARQRAALSRRGFLQGAVADVSEFGQRHVRKSVGNAWPGFPAADRRTRAGYRRLRQRWRHRYRHEQSRRLSVPAAERWRQRESLAGDSADRNEVKSRRHRRVAEADVGRSFSCRAGQGWNELYVGERSTHFLRAWQTHEDRFAGNYLAQRAGGKVDQRAHRQNHRSKRRRGNRATSISENRAKDSQQMNFPRRRFLGSSALVLGSTLLDALATPLWKWKRSALLEAATVPSPPETSPVTFVDVAKAAGLNSPNVWGGVDHKRYIVEAKGSGLAFFDYDQDGWLDIYLTNGTRLDAKWPEGKAPTSRLYKNNRDGTFTDVTEKSGLARTGWQTGVCVGDYDNDGWDDLFCCFWGHNILFHNNGDGTFTDVTRTAGVYDEKFRWGAGCTSILMFCTTTTAMEPSATFPKNPAS